MKRYIHNGVPVTSQTGFSLVEVLIAVGILSVIGAAMMTMIHNMTLSVAYVTAQQDMIALRSEIASFVTTEMACQNAFKANTQFNLDIKTAGTTAGQPIKFAIGGGVVVEKGAKIGNIEIDSLNLINATQVGSTSTNRYYRADVWLKAKTRTNVLGPREFPGKVVASMNLTTSTTGALKTCGATSALESQLWSCSDASGIFAMFGLSAKIAV